MVSPRFCVGVIRASSSSTGMISREALCSAGLSSVRHRGLAVPQIRTQIEARRNMSQSQQPPPPVSRESLPPDVVRTNSQNPYTAAETDDYLESKLILPNEWANDPALTRSRQRALEAGIPEIAVSPLQGQFLAILAKAMGASKILEIGTLWGYSTVFLTKALPLHGQIDTLELDPTHARVAGETFLDMELYPFPTIHTGPALETLKSLQPPGSAENLPDAGYDFVFIDADKARIHEYFQESLRLTRKGGVIVVDNAVRGGKVAREQAEGDQVNVTGLRRLYDWIEGDKGRTVLCSGLQTVGAKSWDGFVIATKL